MTENHFTCYQFLYNSNSGNKQISSSDSMPCEIIEQVMKVSLKLTYFWVSTNKFGH
jgi:hypothetical protein